MKIVEVRINLDNPNEKVIFDYFDITKETERLYIAEIDEWDRKTKRFLKESLNRFTYDGKVNICYRFVTNSENYREIEKSKQAKIAVEVLSKRHKEVLDYWQRTLEYRKERYYKDCVWEVEE